MFDPPSLAMGVAIETTSLAFLCADEISPVTRYNHSTDHRSATNGNHVITRRPTHRMQTSRNPMESPKNRLVSDQKQLGTRIA